MQKNTRFHFIIAESWVYFKWMQESEKKNHRVRQESTHAIRRQISQVAILQVILESCSFFVFFFLQLVFAYVFEKSRSEKRIIRSTSIHGFSIFSTIRAYEIKENDSMHTYNFVGVLQSFLQILLFFFSHLGSQ